MATPKPTPSARSMTGSAPCRGTVAKAIHPDEMEKERALCTLFFISGYAPVNAKNGQFGNRTVFEALSMQINHLNTPNRKDYIMLGWALTFLVIALIAGALGFGGIAGASAGMAQILFFIFIVLFVVAMIARAVRGRPPV